MKALFNNNAGIIDGELIPLSKQELEAIQRRNIQLRHDAIEEIFGPNISAKKKQALRKYSDALSADRCKDIKKALKVLDTKISVQEIEEKTEALLYDIEDVKQQVKSSLRKRITNASPILRYLVSLFSNKYKQSPHLKTLDQNERTYFRLLNKSTSSVQPEVEHFLAKNGYEITDYSLGYATKDKKNIEKIGKLINKLPNAPKGLLKAFSSDPCRINEDLLVILSRNPTDIARGSHKRGWKSCRAGNAYAASTGVTEYEAGVFVAYLVNAHDIDIHDPLSRIYVKPFTSDEETVYLSFNPIGLHVPSFMHAVNQYADQNFNAGKTGKYTLTFGCEHFMEPQTRTILDDDPRKALEQLKVNFSICDGQITVEEGLNLENLGLHKLPNFKDVIVKKHINISQNKLLTLDGLPNAPLQRLTANETLISSFHGCTAQIDGTFSYVWSPYLTSGIGAPEAKRYMYGGGRYDDGTASSKTVCPIHEPGKFPSFCSK